MAKKASKTKIDRRTFLKDVAVAGAASGLLNQAQAESIKTADSKSTVSAAVPSNKTEAMERELPAAYTKSETAKYFVNQPVSDFMVDTIRSLDIELESIHYFLTTIPQVKHILDKRSRSH